MLMILIKMKMINQLNPHRPKNLPLLSIKNPQIPQKMSIILPRKKQSQKMIKIINKNKFNLINKLKTLLKILIRIKFRWFKKVQNNNKQIHRRI